MNQKYALVAVLVAGVLPLTGIAQSSPASPEATAPAVSTSAPTVSPAPSAPQAYPAKIALVAFQQAVVATNEGQQAVAEIQKKFLPKQTQLEALNNEIDALKKQMQAAPATLSDAERAARMKTLDSKQKQLDRDTDDARTAYQADLQEAYRKVAEKVNVVLLKYVQASGYTLLLDVGNEQSSVMWAARDPSADITQAVIAAYNASTPTITAPPPAAPSAARPRPAAITPKAPTPKPQAPKPQAK